MSTRRAAAETNRTALPPEAIEEVGLQDSTKGTRPCVTATDCGSSTARSSHRLAMLRNMTNSLLTHEVIKTTLPKAKELRRVAEPLITLGKTPTLANRRLAFNRLRDRDVVVKLFDELGPALPDAPRRLPAHPEVRLPPRRQCADGAGRAGRSSGAERDSRRRPDRRSADAGVLGVASLSRADVRRRERASRSLACSTYRLAPRRVRFDESLIRFDAPAVSASPRRTTPTTGQP